MQNNFEPKCATCLHIATLRGQERVKALERAIQEYSFRAIHRKFEELVKRGYVIVENSDVAPEYVGRLTAKGSTALRTVKELPHGKTIHEHAEGATQSGSVQTAAYGA